MIEVRFTELEQATLAEVISSLLDHKDVALSGVHMRELASALDKIDSGLIVEDT